MHQNTDWKEVLKPNGHQWDQLNHGFENSDRQQISLKAISEVMAAVSVKNDPEYIKRLSHFMNEKFMAVTVKEAAVVAIDDFLNEKCYINILCYLFLLCMFLLINTCAKDATSPPEQRKLIILEKNDLSNVCAVSLLCFLVYDLQQKISNILNNVQACVELMF